MNTNLKRSTSSIVLEFLRSQPQNLVFTTNEIYLQVLHLHPNTTVGAVHGFISKIAAKGHLSVQRTNGVNHYKIVNLDNVRIQQRPGTGSPRGRIINRKKSTVTRVPASEVIRDRLLNIAAMVESIRTPISSFTTEELLKELAKRYKAEAK